MRKDIVVRGASFTGTTDLTIVAPIKKGFVPSLDAVTYKTRVVRVLKALHLGRQTGHEYDLARVMSDAVERVGRIHSIRIAIIKSEDEATQDKVMLAVTFDGSWESYIRVIWQKVSRSLDLIFCNTEGYVTGWEHTFDEWCAWLRKSQAEAPFLYSPPGLTYQDTQYLRMYERRLRATVDVNDPDDPAKADLAVTQISIPTAEDISDSLCDDGTDPTNLGLDQVLDEETVGRPAFRQGMRTLAGLYRLADVHLPGSTDGYVLHRAASELLREFLKMVNNPGQYQDAITFAELRFHDALDWLRGTPATDRLIPALPPLPDETEYPDVQGGIIQGYPDVSDGCLLFLAFDSAQGLGEFLAKVPPTTATATLLEGDIAVNIALTLQGLRLAGLTDDEVTALPEEFAQGMERRAGTLGDVRVNHPRRWRLPAQNWRDGIKAEDVTQDDPCPRVDLSSVHLVLQLRIRNTKKTTAQARQLLLDRYDSLVTGISAPRGLSIQWMHHLSAAGGETREHFGFFDSASQPVLKESEEGKKFRNHIHLGEILLGHANAADPAPKAGQNGPVQDLLRNGSFLVVRKLRQDVGALEQALADTAKATTPANAPPGVVAAQRLNLMGKMVGRWPIGHAHQGEALAKGLAGNSNDFSFDRDEKGKLCPFHAHIRRANPRDNTIAEPPGARPPRLLRRGMSYGPLYDPSGGAASLAQERGLVFMAYNASIGEQFEVVQRWLTGGNSSGSYSGQSDPLLGLAEPGRPRYFRFEDNGCPVRMRLDGTNRVHDDPRPFVRLEWGIYLLTPAMPALKELARRALDSGKKFAKSWSIEQGEEEIARLRRVERAEGTSAAFDAWKAAIEDPTSAAEFSAASIWAAIRKNHGGVLDTPYGVLVASRDLVDQVLRDRGRNLTATGYLPRMHRSFGPLYLGMDAGQIDGTYERESKKVNETIMDLVGTRPKFEAAVNEAADRTCAALDALKTQAAKQAIKQCERHWEVTFDAREVIDEVLAGFCEEWFGLSEKGNPPHLKKGGVNWVWKPGNKDDPPRYPGHFMAPSRYVFQPHPGADVERIGAEHGLALRIAVTNYLNEFGPTLREPVARAALDCGATLGDPTYAPRTLAGVLMGFLPTTDGNIRRVLNEWLNEGTLWSLRARYQSLDPADPDAKPELEKHLRAKFIEAMQLRAAPELLWRTAATSHVIGRPGPDAVSVDPGRIVVASLISATQECLEDGIPSVIHAFGGDRHDPAGAPTHACPGYGPAEAVMYGFFRGMVISGLSLRPGPAALTFYMDGNVQLPASCGPVVLTRITRSQPESLVQSPKTPLLAIGDSWLADYNIVRAFSLTTELKTGYDLDTNFARVGRKLAAMADPEMLAQLTTYLANYEGEPDAPRAILLGGGGNDLVDPANDPRSTRLFKMLVPNATSATAALDLDELNKFLYNGDNASNPPFVPLISHYRAILDAVTKATQATPVPILVHAYDHPIPDGTASNLGPGPWLKSVFSHKDINIPQPISDGVMRTLIDQLNLMVATVASGYPGRVYHLNDLPGTLENQPDFGSGIGYKKYWANELHGTQTGFQVLAGVVRAKLVALRVHPTSIQAVPPP